jgi:hypothetical protein
MKLRKVISSNIIDILFLLIIGPFTVAIFLAEINIVDETPGGEAVFNALEFVLSIIIGWILKRIAS